MKQDPYENQDLTRYEGSDLQEVVDRLISLTRRDEENRSTWDRNQDFWWQRRLCLVDRDTTWPWPNASNFIAPVEDMNIDRTVAVLAGTYLAHPIVNFKVTRPDPELFSRRVHDNVFFNWALEYGSEGFEEQMLITFDQSCQGGIAITKTYWDYRIGSEERIFSRQHFLARHRGRMERSVGDITLESGLDASVIFGARGNGSVARRNAERAIDELRPQIVADLALDVDDKLDRDALQKIVAGMKKGQDLIPYRTHEVKHNLARTIWVDPRDLIVPPNATRNFALRKTHRMWFTDDTMMAKVEHSGWNETAVEEAITRADRNWSGGRRPSVFSSGRFKDFLKDMHEGIHSWSRDAGDGEGMHEVWETRFYHDIDGDGLKEWSRAILHPGSGLILKDIVAEDDDPFDYFGFELQSDRWYSPRGIPQKVDHLAWLSTSLTRAEMNNLDMLVPMMTTTDPQIKAADIGYVPGEVIKVASHAALQRVEVPDYTLQHERADLRVQGWIERYIGGFDMLASQQQIHEARTKAEIDAITSSNRQILGHRLTIFGLPFRSVIRKHVRLFHKYGSAGLYQAVTGVPFRRMSRQELERNYTIVPVARLENLDPQTLRARRIFWFQTLLQAVQVNNGQRVFDGEYELKLGQLLRRLIEDESPEDAPVILREIPEEERRQLAEQQARQADSRRRMEENLGNTPSEIRENLRNLGRGAPHGKAQRILTR